MILIGVILNLITAIKDFWLSQKSLKGFLDMGNQEV